VNAPHVNGMIEQRFLDFFGEKTFAFDLSKLRF
jgi:hypothetical protein